MPLLIQEAVNLYVGDNSPNANKRNNLASIKLPTMEEITSTVHPGGSYMAVQVGGLGMNALEITFKLFGYDPHTMDQFGLNGGIQPYTSYGLVRAKDITHRAIEVKAIAWGRLTRIESDEFSRGGDVLGHDHTIQEIMRYGLWFDEKEKFFFDFDTGERRVNGVRQNAEESRILRY
jgi:phage tail tube protein FII